MKYVVEGVLLLLVLVTSASGATDSSYLVQSQHTDKDLTGFSIKVHGADGVYKWTQPFEMVEDGVWKTPRHSSYWFIGDKVELQYLIYHNKDLSQKRVILATEEEKVTDVRWTDPSAGIAGV